VEGLPNNSVLTYRVKGYVIPVKDVNTFEPITVDLELYGADKIGFINRGSIEKVLKMIGINMSINVKGIYIYYNCSENAGEKPVTYRLGPDGWYWISVPVGPCVIHNVPLLLKLNGEVSVEQINDTAFKVHMKVRLTSDFENNISGYKVIVRYPQGFPVPINGSIEADLSYVIVNNTAISRDNILGFSPLYIVYPKNAAEVKELYEKKSLITLYGIPLEFKMKKYYVNALGHNVTSSYIIAYARSNKYVDLMSHVIKIMNLDFYREYLQPIYKGKPLIENMIDFALSLIIKHENVTQYITYSPTRTVFTLSVFLYKDLTLPYNLEGKIIEYRWTYPLSFWGVFLKFRLSNGKNMWMVFWGNAEYDRSVNPYSIDIGYFNPDTSSIDIKQVLLFIAIVVLPICVIIYYFLKRR